MTSWFGYLWSSPTPQKEVDQEYVEIPKKEPFVEKPRTEKPRTEKPYMVFPCAAITFTPQLCSKCKKYRNRRDYTFVQWKKLEGTGCCIKCST